MLWVEVAVLLALVIGGMWLHRRRFVGRSAIASWLIVVACALIASVSAIVTGIRSAQLCLPGDVHYTPTLGEQWARAAAEAAMQAHVAFAIMLVTLLIGTAFTARMLLLRERRQ